MNHCMNQKEINKLKHEINEDYEQIKILKLQIKTINDSIKCKQNKLYNNCEHEKEIDRTYQDEHTQYICKKCGIHL